MPGSFEFGTDQKELMEIPAGEMEVLLPGNIDWKKVHRGESFEVPAKSCLSQK